MNYLLSASILLSTFLGLSAQFDAWQKTGEISEFTIQDYYISPSGTHYIFSKFHENIMYSSEDGINWTELPSPYTSYKREMKFGADNEVYYLSSSSTFSLQNGQWNQVYAGSNPVEYVLIEQNYTFLQTYSKVFVQRPGETQEILVDFKDSPRETTISFHNELLYLIHERGFDNYVLDIVDMNGNYLLENKILDIDYIGDLYFSEDGVAILIARDQILVSDDLFDSYEEFVFPYGRISNSRFQRTVDSQDDLYFVFDLGVITMSKSAPYDSKVNRIENFAANNILEIAHNLYLIGESEIRIYTDNSFASYTPYKPDIDLTNITKLMLGHEEQLYSLTGSERLFYSKDNGQNWQEIITDDNETKIKDIRTDDNGDLFYVSNMGIYKTSGSGESSLQLKPNFSSFRIDQIKGNTILMHNSISLLFSRDLGQTWYHEIAYKQFNYGNLDFIDELVFAATDKGVLVYDMKKKEYQATLFDDTRGYNNSVVVTDEDLVLMKINPSSVQFNQPENYYVSTDRGLSFQKYIPEPEDLIGLGSYTMRKGSQNLVYFLLNNYLVYSLDSGASFTTADLHGSSDNLFTVLGTSTNSDYGYLADSRGGIYRSSEAISSSLRILGTAAHDENDNCTVDEESILNGWKIIAERTDGHTYARLSSQGRYSLNLPEGDYSFTVIPRTQNWDHCEIPDQIKLSKETPEIDLDILGYALEECAELTVDMSIPFLRRCADQSYYVTITNYGPEASENTELLIYMDPFFIDINANLPYKEIRENELLFDLGRLEFNEVVQFKLDFNLSCEAELGQLHCVDAAVRSDNSCDSALDKQSTAECQENIGSYDPNDIRSFTTLGIETDSFRRGEYIHYMVRFQNTGTDTAFRVKVINQLSSDLDLTTFEFLGSSHRYEYNFTDGLNLLVDYSNILLPDSTTNLFGSNGFFKYKIRPKLDLELGKEVVNVADIYFDYNEPVRTNLSTILLYKPEPPTNDTKELIPVYPNPSLGSINLGERYSGISGEVTMIAIDGRKIMTHNTSDLSEDISITSLDQGVYMVHIKLENREILRSKFLYLK